MTTEKDLQDGEILCPFCGEAATDGSCLRLAAERIAALEAENERLRTAAAFYLRERPCFGIGSRMGCCANAHLNTPAKRCVHLSDDPEEYCFSGKFMEALGIVGEDAAGKLAALRARADDAGRVELAAKWMRKDAFGFSDPDVDLDKEWVELEEGEREAWRRDARAVLAAADGREP